MRPIRSRRGDWRGEMLERQRRDRAVTQTMRARYPRMTSLRLEFDFTDGGAFTPAPQVTVLHPPATAYFIFPCPFSDCDGEFNLAPVVDGLAAGDRKFDEGRLQCCGQRTGTQEKRLHCGLVLEYTMHAQLG